MTFGDQVAANSDLKIGRQIAAFVCVRELFRRLAHKTGEAMARPAAFIAASVLIAAWLVSGPLFHFSDTWQLIINTSTTVITFLMVFLIQNSQNRDTRAIQLKLDELLRAVKAARTELVDLEDVPDEQLDRLQHEFSRLAARKLANGKVKNNKGRAARDGR